MLSVEPPSTSVSAGDTFSLDVFITDVTDLYAYQFDVSFDPGVLSAQDLTEGSFLATGGATFFIPGSIDNVAGLISFTATTLLGPDPGVSGNGTLAVVEFSAIGTGTSPIDLSNVLLLDSTIIDITADVVAGAVDVQDNGGSIPEPATLWLLALGAGWLGLHRLRRSIREEPASQKR
jgi:general secretion pathway protein D